MLDPRKLAVLREFHVQGTIARAAEALAFTPSAVSQQLAALERELGVPLTRRAGRRLELTDAGRLLVDRADDLLDHHERVETELAAVSGDVAGTVRVAAFQTALRFVVMPAVAEVPEGVRVELVEAEAELALPLLARGELDVVVAEEYEHAPRPRLPRIERDYLEPDEMVLAAAAGRRGPLSLRALRDAEWATAREGTAYADMLARLCRSQGGFEPNVRHRVNDMRLLLELVAADRAVALLPALGRPAEDPRVRVKRVGVTRAIFAATRSSDRDRPATAAVVEALGAG
ncbi:MAG: LysR family transcriptional regulator [Actinomycetota bacterium]|nr:LysR family transcriptional regulator [Actinomycetota bacterium]